MVADDFGKYGGPGGRPTVIPPILFETVIQDLLTGQYNNPPRVVAFNTAKPWSEDVAQELRRRCDLQMRVVPFYLQGFIDRYEGRHRDVLPIPIRLA